MAGAGGSFAGRLPSRVRGESGRASVAGHSLRSGGAYYQRSGSSVRNEYSFWDDSAGKCIDERSARKFHGEGSVGSDAGGHPTRGRPG